MKQIKIDYKGGGGGKYNTLVDDASMLALFHRVGGGNQWHIYGVCRTKIEKADYRAPL